MPTVEDMDGAGSSSGTNEPNEGTSSEVPPQQPQGAVAKIVNHMSRNKVEAALWATRLFTVGCVFNFFIPIWAYPANAYHKALLSNAATSALRLHQRLPQFQFSREFLGRMFLEDSAHYLFYCIIFLTGYPLTMVLIPVFLFALLHAQSYTKQLLNLIGPNSVQLLRGLMSKLEAHQVNVLRFIAINEIFLMPGTIFMIFTGSSSLLMPFMYYRFLSLRYASQRNPYCRQVFYELRVSVEMLIARPQCPAPVRNMCNRAISFVSRLAPPVVVNSASQ